MLRVIRPVIGFNRLISKSVPLRRNISYNDQDRVEFVSKFSPCFCKDINQCFCLKSDEAIPSHFRTSYTPCKCRDVSDICSCMRKYNSQERINFVSILEKDFKSIKKS